MFIITRNSMEERCIQDSLDVRGPYNTMEEATCAINAWVNENEDTGTWWNDELFSDEETLTTYQIHTLSKCEFTNNPDQPF